MKRILLPVLALIVGAASTNVFPFSQQPAPVNTDMHYQIGPDSLPREGVPKGEVRGPFTLPSTAYPGTQHTYNYTWGIGRHGQKQGGPMVPEMMRWLWRDHPVSTDVNDTVERSFNARR